MGGKPKERKGAEPRKQRTQNMDIKTKALTR